MANLGKSCVAEGTGAFALSFIGAGAICLTTHMGPDGPGLLGVALAHGIILSIAVSATMNISGGHVNPAVTLAMLATGRIGFGGAIAYIIAQLIGATIAGGLVYLIFRGMVAPGGANVVAASALGTPNFNPAQLTAGMAILIEAVLTFLLLFAVFGTAVDPRAPKIGGFGIGLTIAADILVGGPLTGASMNPSRTFGPGLVAALTGNLPTFGSQQIVYWIGPVLGGVVAGLLYQFCILDKKDQ